MIEEEKRRIEEEKLHQQARKRDVLQEIVHDRSLTLLEKARKVQVVSAGELGDYYVMTSSILEDRRTRIIPAVMRSTSLNRFEKQALQLDIRRRKVDIATT